MASVATEPGSFRDPGNEVFYRNGEVLRRMGTDAAEHFRGLKESGLLDRLCQAGRLVATHESSGENGAAIVLRHERIPLVSYPYEWSFPLLKAAALLQLNVHIEALKDGFNLSDASAYNVQFKGAEPVFIDVGSFRRYRDGEIWAGHRQFCEQFLNPLLLRALFGIPHNAWFRGNLEGVETAHLARMMPWWRNFSFNVLSHVTLQAKLQAQALTDKVKSVAKAREVAIPKLRLERMLMAMRDWIAGLEPKDTGATVWKDYAENTTYDDQERTAKRAFIAAFCSKVKPKQLWDIGCNTGDYSEVALQSGAQSVIGFDFDQGALQRAYARAKAKSLNFLPLYQDGANPSPGQGWDHGERKAIAERRSADALIALAFEHHLAIGRNIPLTSVVTTLVQSAPTGVIEFVQKSDPTVQQLLALRDDIFPGYTQDAFEAALKNQTRIVKAETVSSAGRRLYWYDRG
jgi:ribosomal protein L11 methylase PrmA